MNYDLKLYIIIQNTMLVDQVYYALDIEDTGESWD
jgi:hypothetical protein